MNQKMFKAYKNKKGGNDKRGGMLRKILACVAVAALIAGSGSSVLAADPETEAALHPAETSVSSSAEASVPAVAESGTQTGENPETQEPVLSQADPGASASDPEAAASSSEVASSAAGEAASQAEAAASLTETPDPETEAEEQQTKSTESASEEARNAELPITETEALNFGISSSITGRDSANTTFTYEVYEADYSYNIQGKSKAEATTPATLTKDEAAYLLTDALKYQKAGTFYYVVKEKAGNAGGWTYDADEYRFMVETETVQTSETEQKVRVKSIVCTKGGLEDLNFTVTSDPSSDRKSVTITSGTLSMTSAAAARTGYFLYSAENLSDLVDPETGAFKTDALSNANVTPAAGDLKAVTGGYQYTVTATGLDDTNKKVYAVLVKGTKADGSSAYTYESFPIAVFRFAAAKLTAASSSETAAGTEETVTTYPTVWKLTVPGLAFANTYEVKKSDSASFTIYNTISDESGSAPEETFAFTAVRSSTANGRTVATPKISGEGSASFSTNAITYTADTSKSNTYRYTVTETAGSAPGWYYDSTVYYIAVTASDDGEGGTKLTSAIHTGSWSGPKAESITFSNKYVTGEYSFTAVDSDDEDQAVEGAVFTLYGIKAAAGSSDYMSAVNNLKSGKVVDSDLQNIGTYESDADGMVTLPDLVGNSYYVVKQTDAASGYQKSANPVVLHTNVTNSGNFGATVTSSGNGTLDTANDLWAQHPVKVIVNMRSSSGAFLTNAKLKMTDVETGEVVDEWKSGASGHEVDYLVAGRQYKIEQTNKLVGYARAQAVTFTVTEYDVQTEDYMQYVTVTSQKGAAGGAAGTGASGSGTTRTGGASTGDTSPVIPLVIVFAAAAAVIILIFVRRRKK